MRNITKTLKRIWFVRIGGQEAKVVILKQQNQDFPVCIQCMALGYIGDFVSLESAENQLPLIQKRLEEVGFSKGTAKSYFKRMVG